MLNCLIARFSAYLRASPGSFFGGLPIVGIVKRLLFCSNSAFQFVVHTHGVLLSLNDTIMTTV